MPLIAVILGLLKAVLFIHYCTTSFEEVWRQVKCTDQIMPHAFLPASHTTKMNNDH